MNYCVVALPSFCCFLFGFYLFFVLLLSGRIHRRGVWELILSFSPLFYRFSTLKCGFSLQSGRFTGEETLMNTLVLPSLNRNSVLMILCYFNFVHFDTLHFGLSICAFCHFEHFWWFALSGAPSEVVIYHRGSWPYTMYIYSLRHFLTTKGALIDGDGYPPKNPKNDPKNHSKLTKIWSKLRRKNGQKQWFLM